MATQLWAVIVVIAGTFIGSFGPILFKKATKNLNFHPIKLITNYILMLGFFLYGISAIFFIIAIRGGELSVLYPLVSINYIWVSFLSIKFLNEKMNLYKWLGIIMIIFGVSMIGIGS